MPDPDLDGPRPPRGRGWRVLGWVSIALSVVIVAASLTSYGFYRQLQGNIKREDVSDRLGANRPQKLGKGTNILLLGSDSREGENARYGVEEGQRSDTTILLHISPGGAQAVGISFPRDLMVQIPNCKTTKGRVVPGGLGMFNSAFAKGGAACTWQTVESLTRIRIDHYVQIDFTGFKRVVDALGGVEICVPKAINDPKAELVLRKGRQIVRGDQALGYVRTRTGGLGDGSDLSRIDRQKKFMAAVAQKATSSDTFTDPGKLYGFLNAITKSIKTDSEFTVSAMQELAGGLRGMSAGKVRFVTAPWEAYPPDHNRVQLNRAQAAPLFDAVRRDNSLPPPAPPAPPPPPPGAPPPQQPLPNQQVKISVYNAAGIDGLAGRTVTALTAQRFQASIGGTARLTRTTKILYGPGGERAAAALAKLLPGKQPTLKRDGRPGLVYLVLGSDWRGLKNTGPTVIPKVAGEVRADANPCEGG
ncbi:LCP family protein [Actinomadura craniellae]|uniref:LCP family protein n=1 Tax=Actinomadura craniellae TaxID=2231787 RepID=UPI001F3F9E06|nr:LCP family protein [Actinomadura craniellae]